MYNVSFNGETAGSVAKRELTPQRRYEAPVQLPEQAPDTVSFRGKEEKEESSFLGGLVKTLVVAGLVVGGLGYAHKTGAVGKLKDGKLKDLLKNSNKITEPCYKWYQSAKEFCVKNYNKIKDFFVKKK